MKNNGLDATNIGDNNENWEEKEETCSHLLI